MTETVLIATGLLTALAAFAAALFAGLAIRAQDRAQRRQQALENFRWLSETWDRLRPQRARAAAGIREERDALTDLREVLNFLESVGFLVRHHLLDLDTTEAVLAAPIRAWWQVASTLVASGRAEYGPTIYEDIEWLHGQLRVAWSPVEGWRDRFLIREEGTAVRSQDA